MIHNYKLEKLDFVLMAVNHGWVVPDDFICDPAVHLWNI